MISRDGRYAMRGIEPWTGANMRLMSKWLPSEGGVARWEQG